MHICKLALTFIFVHSVISLVISLS